MATSQSLALIPSLYEDTGTTQHNCTRASVHMYLNMHAHAHARICIDVDNLRHGQSN